jgi:ABC-type polysaccharide/polyol phosphate transport system ATPase subunit
MSSNAIVLNNVTKVYSKYTGLQKIKNVIDTVKNGQIGKKLVKAADFYALNNINIKIRKGECFGIIGPNGAGKSTILKIINKITYPTEGKVVVHGKVGGLLELGAGFHPDLPGKDNVYINAALFGFSKKKTSEIFDEILNISELHHYINVPIKKYSSGMKVRLGFAVAMATNPEIVLLDEVLAVGDAKFRDKSFKLMKQYISNKTVVFVSHNMNQIAEVCTRVIVLDHGNILFDGDPTDAIKYYEEFYSSDKQRSGIMVLPQNIKRGFSERPKIKVKKVKLYDQDFNEIQKVSSDGRIIIMYQMDVDKVLGDMFVKIVINKLLLDKFSEVIDEFKIKLPKENIDKGETSGYVSFDPANLRPGDYKIDITPSFERQSDKTALYVYSQPFTIESETDEKQIGLVNLDFEIENAPH